MLEMMHRGQSGLGLAEPREVKVEGEGEGEIV